jgi:PAS domain S-box-containing protein
MAMRPVTETPLRALLVEESPSDANVIVSELRSLGRPLDYERVEDASSMAAALERGEWHVVISDLSMSRFSAIGALELLKRCRLDMPFILVSGTDTPEAVADAMRAGANDYVHKNRLVRLVPAVERAFNDSRERAARRAAEEEVRKSDLRFRRLWDSGLILVDIGDPSGGISDINDAGLRMLGYSREELVSGRIGWSDLTPPEWMEAEEIARSALTGTGVVAPWEKELIHKDGHRVPILAGAATIEGGQCIGIAIDLTARKRAEAEARHQATRFRALVENSVDGIAMIALDGTLLYVSPAITRILGRTAGEILGKKSFDYAHPDDLERAREQFRSAVAKPGPTAPSERRVLRPNGTYRYVEVTLTNMADDPAVGAMVGNVRDVTERKEAEAALRLSEARFARLAESGIVGIVLGDVHGNVQDVNDAYLGTFGYSRDDVRAGKVRWDSSTPPEWKATNDRALLQLKNDGVAPPWEQEVFRKDGSRIQVLVGAAMLDGPNFVGFVVDLSDRKRAERALRETEDQLRQAQKMEAVGRLAGGVAHDFNNVLSVILSYAELLLADLPASDPMHADIEEIRKAGGRATDLTRQLLMFSRQQAIEPRVVVLDDLLSNMQKM